ncbi:MAG: VOC family protein [Alphaproteobacteria bacterium]|nr:MAG: VOC family protein [Alphaproteobacteria bacterium]TAF15943.1 MAG: VOC family protein [Alphaproteobacteria bacterium]TAF41940.1 MAG: VOC family protein [Alphaproteobacteria bacterium]TAF76757.1 MAG: VOC family protein [Alphaproteobacteria bacterium]
MLGIKGIHHIAVICSDYERSRHFFTTILGCEIIAETYREQRKSYKLDLRVDANTQIELFSFPEPPKRTSRPEACGLRHLAFAVDDLDKACDYLRSHDIEVEPIRTDELTGKRFTFFADPDDLPLELYES